MSLENQWLEDVFPTEIVHFSRGHVSFQGCMCYRLKSSQEMYEMQEIPGEDDAVRGKEGPTQNHWGSLKNPKQPFF